MSSQKTQNILKTLGQWPRDHDTTTYAIHCLFLATKLIAGRLTVPGVEWTGNTLSLLNYKFCLELAVRQEECTGACLNSVKTTLHPLSDRDRVCRWTHLWVYKTGLNMQQNLQSRHSHVHDGFFVCWAVEFMRKECNCVSGNEYLLLR